MATQQLLKIIYAIDIKFWVRWFTCSMNVVNLFAHFFLISRLILKTNIRTLNTFKD